MGRKSNLFAKKEKPMEADDKGPSKAQCKTPRGSWAPMLAFQSPHAGFLVCVSVCWGGGWGMGDGGWDYKK